MRPIDRVRKQQSVRAANQSCSAYERRLEQAELLRRQSDAELAKHQAAMAEIDAAFMVANSMASCGLPIPDSVLAIINKHTDPKPPRPNHLRRVI